MTILALMVKAAALVFISAAAFAALAVGIGHFSPMEQAALCAAPSKTCALFALY